MRISSRPKRTIMKRTSPEDTGLGSLSFLAMNFTRGSMAYATNREVRRMAVILGATTIQRIKIMRKKIGIQPFRSKKNLLRLSFVIITFSAYFKTITTSPFLRTLSFSCVLILRSSSSDRTISPFLFIFTALI